MKKILFILAHPHLRRSRANRRIADRVRNLPGLEINDLYENYPQFFIDVKTEQKKLLENDIIVFQHPFYWYSQPPLMKLWCDEVLEMGFAYVEKGNALQGKDFLLSITAGAAKSSYSPEGTNRFPIESFFPPFEQTANLIGMKWHNPLVLFSSLRSSDEELEIHAEKVRDTLFDLSQGKGIVHE